MTFRTISESKPKSASQSRNRAADNQFLVSSTFTRASTVEPGVPDGFDLLRLPLLPSSPDLGTGIYISPNLVMLLTPDDDHSNEHQSQVSSGLLSAFLDSFKDPMVGQAPNVTIADFYKMVEALTDVMQARTI